jgi:hypothetical protein
MKTKCSVRPTVQISKLALLRHEAMQATVAGSFSELISFGCGASSCFRRPIGISATLGNNFNPVESKG